MRPWLPGPEPQFAHCTPHTEARGPESNPMRCLRDNHPISSCFDVRVSQWSPPVVLPQWPFPPEAPNAPRQDTESKALGWGRIPGSIDSRAGPHGYGFSVYRPSLGGSGSLKTFRPSAKHRDGSVWHVVTGGKPNARRGKNLLGESCIFRPYSLELPFLLRTSLMWSVCATSWALPQRRPRLGLAWPALPGTGASWCGAPDSDGTCRVPGIRGRSFCQRQEVPSKAGLTRLVPFLL